MARLAIAGVPNDLAQALRKISVACWRDLQEELEHSGGNEAGISRALLEAREEVHHAIRAALLREDSRKARLRLGKAALASVDAATQ
jgi:hypothetical protein